MNVIDIIKAVPVRAEVKFPREPAFHFRYIGRGQGNKAAGDSPGVRVQKNFFHRRPPVSGTDGERIHTFAAEMGEKTGTVFRNGKLLQAPAEKIGKGILTAALGTCHQQPVILRPLTEIQPMKFNHL